MANEANAYGNREEHWDGYKIGDHAWFVPDWTGTVAFGVITEVHLQLAPGRHCVVPYQYEFTILDDPEVGERTYDVEAGRVFDTEVEAVRCAEAMCFGMERDYAKSAHDLHETRVELSIRREELEEAK